MTQLTTAKTIVIPADVDDPSQHGVSAWLDEHGIDEDHPLHDELANRLNDTYAAHVAAAINAAGYRAVRSTWPIGTPELDAEIARHGGDNDDETYIPIDTHPCWLTAAAEVDAWLAAR